MKKRWVFVNVVALTVLVCVGFASANTTPSADFDDNGIVGFSDFLVFVDSFGTEVPPPSVSVCDRTPAVRDSIMALVPVSTCGDVTGAHLAAIDSLSLSGARLTELKAGDLSGLTCLTKLNLRENRLSGLPDGLFDDLTALNRLDMGVNRLTAIPSELFALPSLTYLDLSENRLDGAIPTELGNLSNLTILALYNNRLSGEIPKELGNLSNLTILGLNFSQLGGEIPKELGNLSNLTILALHSNQLSGGIPAELGKLSNLEILTLQDNTSLTGALPQSLTELTKLTQFYFHNTGLCAPLDAAFQAWLQGITDASGSNCSG